MPSENRNLPRRRQYRQSAGRCPALPKDGQAVVAGDGDAIGYGELGAVRQNQMYFTCNRDPLRDFYLVIDHIPAG